MRHELSPSVMPGLVLAILFAALATTGCQTTVGNYFANRGRDLSECFMVQAGLGFGLGVDVKAAGLVHADALMAFYARHWSVGWVYGDPRPTEMFAEEGFPFEGDQGTLFWHRSVSSVGVIRGAHGCFSILPAVLSWEDSFWLWNDIDELGEWMAEQGTTYPPGFDVEGYLKDLLMKRRPMHRWARLHVFDVEVGVFIGVVGVRAGFSPGEFLDFILGWFGVDIAGDDQHAPYPREPGLTPRPSRRDDASVPYKGVLEDPDAPPDNWREAAERAAAAGDRRSLVWFLRGMSRPAHEKVAIEVIVSLGDDAVKGLVNIYTHAQTNPAPREAAGRALRELLQRGALSQSREETARRILECGP
ncbi:MAG: hypothetical protein O7H41_00020 [Planctomycetota bacterium]|nr:hypothetical protein [Planctomycetota bacterium]